VATAVKLEEKIKPPMGCVPSYYFKKKQSRLMELLLLERGLTKFLTAHLY
jgi:hypothetical protein